jgi:hypothetical protein
VTQRRQLDCRRNRRRPSSSTGPIPKPAEHRLDVRFDLLVSLVPAFYRCGEIFAPQEDLPNAIRSASEYEAP